jgi:hypothetical protein
MTVVGSSQLGGASFSLDVKAHLMQTISSRVWTCGLPSSNEMCVFVWPTPTVMKENCSLQACSLQEAAAQIIPCLDQSQECSSLNHFVSCRENLVQFRNKNVGRFTPHIINFQCLHGSVVPIARWLWTWVHFYQLVDQYLETLKWSCFLGVDMDWSSFTYPYLKHDFWKCW